MQIRRYDVEGIVRQSMSRATLEPTLDTTIGIGAKLKNWPTLGHSPGEAACPNVGLIIDSHTQQGMSRPL